jgi:hypothetical protein
MWQKMLNWVSPTTTAARPGFPFYRGDGGSFGPDAAINRMDPDAQIRVKPIGINSLRGRGSEALM